MNTYIYTTKQEINKSFFWFNQTARSGQDYASNPDTRWAFYNFVESLLCNGEISEELAREVIWK